MTGFEAGYLLGLITGGVAGVVFTLTYQWWLDRPARSRIVLDDYTERLRALDRHPSRIE